MSDDKNGRLTEAAIAELKSRFPGVEMALFEAPNGTEMVVRAPDRSTYNMFIADVMNEKKDRSVAMAAYALRCCVYPDKAVVNELFDRYPAFPGLIANQLSEMAGSGSELDVKKL